MISTSRVMFTGIIEDIGIIAGIKKSEGKWEFAVKTRFDEKDVMEGDSVAIDGVCLTATRVGKGIFYADASLETLKVTTLRGRGVGSRVNVERAMAANGRFGGHMVMGHVDGIGSIAEMRNDGESLRLKVEVPADVGRYIVKKGSVAIDGISLTVNDQSDNTFTVNIIPYTASKTAIAEKSLRDTVNIETDIIGKYMERFLSREKERGISKEFLYEHGYMKGE
jgi:riboflavin synthase